MAIAARTSASIVPDSELSAPTLMFGPEVSTHDAAFAESGSVALLPQPDSNRLVAATTLPALTAVLDISSAHRAAGAQK